MDYVNDARPCFLCAQLAAGGRLAWAGAACLAHLGGSLLATCAGIASVELWRRAG